MKNTNTILGIVDSSPIKTGKQLDTFTVMGKQQFLDDYNGQHVVIVSYFSENEIAESLKSLGVTEDRIVRLYAPT
ncbi:MAG: hypothetical protein JKY57_06405 [Kordiimonadaceae bacterium]|nr:hypothetical protein [Kordiimonadaceae bacterium]